MHKIVKTIDEIFGNQSFKVLSGKDTETDICDIAYSSKDVVCGSLFFCVPGTKVDGHDFAKDAVDRGAVALVVNHPLPIDVPQFKVPDVRQALALCSANFFDNPSKKMKVVGITGTNGKTTTTFLVEHIVGACGHKSGLIGTVECRYGDICIPSAHTTPESRDLQELFADMNNADVNVVEMEVSSHAISLGRIVGTQFEVAAFTNLTQDHLDYHKDMEDYFKAKSALFTDFNVKKCVICIDSEYGKRLYDECIKIDPKSAISVSVNGNADIMVKDPIYAPHSTRITLCYGGQDINFTLPLVGRFNVENALVACGIAISLGFSLQEACDALSSSPQVPGRLESVYGLKGTKPDFGVLVDYAHTPDSVAKAISALKAVTSGNVICVFGCGGDRDVTKRPKMGKAALLADIAIVTSDNPRTEDPLAIIEQIIAGMDDEKRYFVYPDRREAIRCALQIAKPGDAVLIAGKGHEDYQIIGTTKYPFDDRLVAAEEIEAL